MPNLFFISEENTFSQDFRQQLEFYAPAFAFSEEISAADVVIVNDQIEELNKLLANNQKTPIVYLRNADNNIAPGNRLQIINKPFALQTLLDTLHAALNLFDNSKDGYLSFNRYQLRPASKEIYNYRNKEITKLTQKEVAILKFLYKNNAEPVSKTDLLQEVWEYNPEASTHTVETHIYRLRQKVEKADKNAELIKTIDGKYQLNI